MAATKSFGIRDCTGKSMDYFVGENLGHKLISSSLLSRFASSVHWRRGTRTGGARGELSCAPPPSV